MQMLNSVVLNKEILNKKVVVGVILNTTQTGMSSITASTKYYEGIVSKIGTLDTESFLVLEDGPMINLKYVQTIEVVE